jgi:general secretion pathway protein D
VTLRSAGGLFTLCVLLAAGTALAQRRPPPLGNRPGVPPLQQQEPTVREQLREPQPRPQAAQGTVVPQAAPQTQQQVDRQRASCQEVRRKARFSVYFDKVDIEKLVQTVADATCKTFILPENVRGKISIIGPENGRVEVTADEFYRAFLAALDSNSLAVYQQGEFLKIVDKRNAKQTPIPTIVDPDAPFTNAEQMVTKIFKIKYVEVEPLRGVLQQLVSQNGDTIPFPPDTIIINDLGSNMHRLGRVIDQLDSRSSSEEMRVIQINYATAQEIADKIQRLFTPQQGAQPGARAGARGRAAITPAVPGPGGLPAGIPEGGMEPGMELAASGPVTVSQIMPDERTNKIILVASPSGYERVLDIIRMLDVPIPGEGRINVYYLENADAEQMASTLQGLASGTGAPQQRPPRPAAQPAVAGQAQPARAGAAPAQSAELFAGEVKISADKATNSLVIVASQADYRNLIKVIERLDLPRRQVFVEAVIMEVNVDRNLSFGGRLHGGAPVKTGQGTLPLLFGSKFGNEPVPPSFSILNLASFGGFLAGLQGPKVPALERMGLNIPAFGVLLHALQESSDVNVLSTPHILTVDNEEAEISVGQNVPFQAGVVPGSMAGLAGLGGLGGQQGAGGLNPALTAGLLGGLGSVVAPINRQNVELRLTVKPQINESDFIRLVITEQIEEIASTDPVLGPTTARRTAKTTIVAKDQETVVIGGIMQDRTIEGVNKVPILGDIPLVGQLFRETSRRKVKTNLLLFLTPYIIKDQSDFRRIFERKMAERQQFVEAFYGHVPGYEVAVDFERKRGPLSEINAVVAREAQRLENGGPGRPDERVFIPGGAPTQLPRSGTGRPDGQAGPEGGQGSGEGIGDMEGSGEAPAPEVGPDVPESREELQTQ